MFCGSCMHDNTWARALQADGEQVSLIPVYTPIRVDEDDASLAQVFFGGINVYLEHRFRFWRWTPRMVREWLNSPSILSLAGRLGVSNDAKRLGALTLAMLRGESGPFHAQGNQLVEFLCRQLKPNVICFSNALLVGLLRQLRDEFRGPAYCVLQGDDVFLEALPEPHRTQVLNVIRDRVRQFDGFLVHSQYYRDFMADYLSVPLDRFHVLPLGIDLSGHDGIPKNRTAPHFTVGYFARVCQTKGLHSLVDVVEHLQTKGISVRLRVGGHLGRQDRAYFREQKKKASRLGCDFQYIGSPSTRSEKVDFLKTLDVLCVPTEYREPKGLYVLEAWANGVPVVQPRHGAFPEMIEATGGGLLFEPGNVSDLASCLEQLSLDEQRRQALARAGHEGVRTVHSATKTASTTLQLFRNAIK